MKISRRKWLGAALVGLSFITWVLLLCFMSRGRVLESHSDRSSSFHFIVTAQSVQLPAWLHFALVGVGGIGILLLVIPGHRRTNA